MNAETKHTPGPWTIDGPPWNQIVWSSAENRVCFLAHSNGANDERDIATGRLIAAAPELFAALAGFVGAVDSGTKFADQSVVDFARAALLDAATAAKATLTAREPESAQVEAEARKICFAMCSTGQFIDPENGCCSICKAESECQSWRCFDSEARAALIKAGG